MALFSVRSNSRSAAGRHLGKFKWRYLRSGSSYLYFTFGSRVGFSRSAADQMALFPVRTNPRWRLAGV